MSDTPTTGFQVGANINPFEQAMRKMVDAARGGQEGVANALGELATGPLASLKIAFSAISAVLAGGFVKDAVTETARMTEEAMDLGRALGVSTNEAKGIQIALEDIGAQSGEFEGAAKGMAKQLKTNEEELNRMGLATRDAAGNLRPMNELVTDGIKVLGEYKEGTDRTLASTVLFGKGIDASSKLMLLNKDVIDDANKTMEQMGLTVGENSVTAWGEFDGAMDKAGFAVQGIKKAIGDALMPVVTTLVNVFNTVMPAAILVVRGALSGLTSAFLFVKNGIVVVWEVFNAFFYSVIEPLRGLTEAMGRAMVGDFSGAATAFKAIGKNVGDVWAGAMDRMTESSAKTAAQVAALFSPDAAPGSGGGAGPGTKGYTAKSEKDKKEKTDKTEKEPKEATAMSTYELALAQRRLVFERENQLIDFSKQRELDYWRDILTTYEVGSKDRTSIAAKMTKLELEIMREAAKDKRAIGQLRAEDYKAETLAFITELESRATFERDQGATTQADYLARLAGFNQQRLQAELDFVTQKIAVAALDPEANVVTLEQLEMQKLEIKRKYAALTADLGRQQAAEQAAPLNNIMATLGQSLSGVANTLLTSWRNIGTALRGVVTTMGQSIIQELVLKPLQARLLAWVKERALTVAGIGADAAKAGSGAAASQAGIPVIGPILAVAAMAAMLATVGGMTSKIPSASGGFHVPKGLNPLTQLHEEEVVLPANIANPLLDMISAGQAPAAAAAAATTQPEAQIRGMPPSEWLMVHRGDLVNALRGSQRDFAFTKF